MNESAGDKRSGLVSAEWPRRMKAFSLYCRPETRGVAARDPVNTCALSQEGVFVIPTACGLHLMQYFVLLTSVGSCNVPILRYSCFWLN